MTLGRHKHPVSDCISVTSYFSLYFPLHEIAFFLQAFKHHKLLTVSLCLGWHNVTMLDLTTASSINRQRNSLTPDLTTQFAPTTHSLTEDFSSTVTFSPIRQSARVTVVRGATPAR
jgi:hypothetical protein